MKKILKLMFGQTSIIIILLVLQIAFLFTSALKITEDEHFVVLNGILRAVSIFVMIYIINGKGNSESKLAWIIQISVFPILGTLLYLFIQGQKLPMIFNKELKRMRRESSPYIKQDLTVLDEIGAIDRQKYNFIRYMNDYADVPVFKNTEAVYYSLGEETWKAMLEEMEKAEKYIFLEYFIIGEGEMWQSILDVLKRKAAQGVDVRLMYDGMGCLTCLPYNYPRKLRQMGIRCQIFNPFRPLLSTIQNNRDHRKILIVDGKVGFIGGINLSDEYVNLTAPYGHWKDTAVMLRGEAVFSLTVMFLELWQISVKRRVEDYEAFRPAYDDLKPMDGYVIPYGDSPFDDELVGETVYIDILSKARDYVHITTPYMIIDREMITALGTAAKSGVDVKIIVPHRADHWYAHAVAKAYYSELISRGIKLYEYMPGFIHSKSFVSDDETAVVGSINMDYRSLYLHFECAAWFYRHDVVKDIEEDFLKTLEKCRPITLESCKVRGIKKVFYAVLRVFAPMM
ncbi:MAG: cardiolipin synthase [Clostridiaceae bacterium]|nr:cardiolipin synthase [Clostridiaceae bacterium]